MQVYHVSVMGFVYTINMTWQSYNCVNYFIAELLQTPGPICTSTLLN